MGEKKNVNSQSQFHLYSGLNRRLNKSLKKQIINKKETKRKIQQTAIEKKESAMLTFSAFFAASAPDRLSKVTNPTGWKTKEKHTDYKQTSKKLHFVK